MTKFKSTQSNDLSEEQREVIAMCMDFIFNGDKQTLVISGVAGSGKTTVIKELVDILNATLKDSISVPIAVMTFTGKASSVLREKGIPIARTIHSHLYIPIIDNNMLVGFDKAGKETYEGTCCFIVDEASMISNSMLDDMLSFGIPVLFFGDKEQLPPVEGRDTDNIMQHYDVHLDKIHRQAAGNPIIQLSKQIRETGTFDKEYFRKHHSNHVRFIKSYDVTKQHLSSPDNKYDIMLCGTNKRRFRLNNLYRVSNEYTTNFPQRNERVICLKNSYAVSNGMDGMKSIYNGEIFIVEAVTPLMEHDLCRRHGIAARTYDLTTEDRKRKVRVSTPDLYWEEEKVAPDFLGIMNSINKNQNDFPPLVPLNYGYAITVHKAQGCEFDDVLFVDEDVSFFLDRRRFRYTAVTRAKERITIATE